ncbi:hypothetical protein [Vreelandella olivaria]|uniref:hypothetical protein n=1 Tax=Vreelandella olivaria TaxID=390919 RepID=UPI00201E7EEF|nr:hypothetical protein [Halomonas olivaria]
MSGPDEVASEAPIKAEPADHQETVSKRSGKPFSMPLSVKAGLGCVVLMGGALILVALFGRTGGGDDEFLNNLNMGLAGTRSDILLLEERVAHVEGYEERLERLDVGDAGLRESLEGLSGVAERLEDLEQRVDQLTSQIEIRLAAFSEQLDSELAEAHAAVEVAEQQTLLARQARDEAQAEADRAATRQASTAQSAAPAPSRPPFSISGVEYRGGRSFLSIATGPVSALGEVRLLGERESEGEWQLVSIGSSSAEFYYRGRSVTVPLP